jgi:hypothetical protein
MRFCKFFLLFCFSALITSAQAEAQDQKQLFLKLNQYYVFTPESYYINNDNRFMVPLRVVDDLIGADVVFNKETKTAEITFSDQEVKFTSDSNKVTINNTPFSMNTKVAYNEKTETLFIPVYILINTFNLNVQWNHTWKQLDINDERIMESKGIPDLKGSDVWRSKVSNANAFRMVHYALRKVHEEEMFTRMQIEFTAENITGYYIHEGKEDIHYWIKLNNSFCAETDTKEQRPRPYVKAKEITKKVIPFDINKGDALNYIVIWPRTV